MLFRKSNLYFNVNGYQNCIMCLWIPGTYPQRTDPAVHSRGRVVGSPHTVQSAVYN